MQAIRKIIDASLLAPIISLPKELQDGEVEIIVLPFTPGSDSVSSSIEAIRTDSNQSEALRHFWSMRKKAEQSGFLSDEEIEAEIQAARAEIANQENLH
jgi:hypothetical protein